MRAEQEKNSCPNKTTQMQAIAERHPSSESFESQPAQA